MRAAVKEIDPAAAVGEAVTMRSVVDGESAPWRFLMRVFVAFALVAAALAIVGLGAVVTLNAAARHRELAIRAALGAGAGACAGWSCARRSGSPGWASCSACSARSRLAAASRRC